jgi:DNA-binding MarR family transcriptional regulator
MSGETGKQAERLIGEAGPGSYELVVLLGLAFRRLIDDLQARLAQAGFDDVRPAHGFAFQLLSFRSAGVNDLAQHLGVTKQAASQMAEYLEQRGYVLRQPDPQDKRGKIISLTGRGWACIRASEQILAGLEQTAAGQLGPAALTALRDMLRKLAYDQPPGTSHQLRPIW